jgi:hypothetical protein
MALAGVPLPADTTLEERRDVKAILKLLEDQRVEVLCLERIIINRELDYAGTLDFRLKFPGLRLPVIGDLKTGARLDLSYPGYRAQSAAYAHASHEVDDQGEIIDAPQVDRDVGFLVHCVPGSGEARFVGMNLLDGWRAFRLAHRVWTHGRGRPRALTLEDTFVTHASIQMDRDAARSVWVNRRIDVLRKLTTDPSHHGVRATKFLRAIWPQDVPLPSATSAWYGDDLHRVVAAVSVTETEYEAPFPPADPTL